MAPIPQSIKKAAIGSRARKKRIDLRERVFPGMSSFVFLPEFGGWSQSPRTAPMVASLIDSLSGKDNAGRLYLTLLSYDYGDGIVEIPDPAQVAFEAGYSSNRAERTFNERMRILRDLGFIITAPLGVREFGYALLIDPHVAVLRLQAARAQDIAGEWMSAFEARCRVAGIDLALVRLRAFPPPNGPRPTWEATSPPMDDSQIAALAIEMLSSPKAQ